MSFSSMIQRIGFEKKNFFWLREPAALPPARVRGTDHRLLPCYSALAPHSDERGS
jgi:hypothetical protein